MKTLKKKLASVTSKGFTLVELLIVIAIVAIIAVGLMVALDPVEQTRRGSDTTFLSGASDVKDAINRYYAGKQYFPWCTSASTPGTCTFDAACTTGTAATLSSACGLVVTGALTAQGELKGTPPTTVASTVYIVPTATSFKMSFLPTSRSMKDNPKTNGTTSACSALTCTVGPTSSCYYCID